MTYAGGELVYDVVTGLPVLDRNGVQLVHAAGDPVLHFRGEAVLHHAAEIRRYLGGHPTPSTLTPTGEPIVDEAGNVVVNGDGTIFVAAPTRPRSTTARSCGSTPSCSAPPRPSPSTPPPRSASGRSTARPSSAR